MDVNLLINTEKFSTNWPSDISFWDKLLHFWLNNFMLSQFVQNFDLIHSHISIFFCVSDSLWFIFLSYVVDWSIQLLLFFTCLEILKIAKSLLIMFFHIPYASASSNFSFFIQVSEDFIVWCTWIIQLLTTTTCFFIVQPLVLSVEPIIPFQ